MAKTAEHPLTEWIAKLKHLTHDELIDLADHIELNDAHARYYDPDPAVAGRARATYHHIRATRKGKQWSPEKGVFGELIKTYMPSTYRAVVVEMARSMAQTLAPMEKRRKRRTGGKVESVAKGRIEVKYIKIPVYDLDTGERRRDDQGRPLSRGAGKVIGYAPEIAGYGPYLYVRVWATGGGRDRSEKKKKSKYVGLKGLAMHLEAIMETAEPGSSERKQLAEQIIDHFIAGTLRQWAKENYPDLGDDDDGEGGDDSEIEADDAPDQQRWLELEENIGEHRIKLHGPIAHESGLKYRCVHKVASGWHNEDGGKRGWKELDKQFLDTADQAERWFHETINSIEDGE
jgi:hypothetical protein